MHRAATFLASVLALTAPILVQADSPIARTGQGPVRLVTVAEGL